LAIDQVGKGQEVAHGATINLDAGKTPEWAGATPLLATVPCPKRCLGSLQPTKRFLPVFCPHASQDPRQDRKRRELNKVKTVRISLCTFRAATSSPDARPTEFVFKRLQQPPLRKSPRKKVKSGGSDPTFWHSIRPKVLSGSLPPIAALWCACVFSRSARLRHSWPPESQASVKWASPPYFTATSPAISPSIEHTSTKMNQMNGPEGRDCARPRPCLRRERPRHLTYRASLALRVAPASGCRKSNGIFRPRKSSVRQLVCGAACS